MLDTLLRGGAAALMLLLAVSGLRAPRRRPTDLYSVIFDVCALAYLLESAPDLRDRHDDWLLPIRLASLATPAAFMVWAEAIFGEGVVPLWRRCLPFGLMLGLGAWAIALDMPLAWRASQAAALLLVAVGLYRSLAGRAGDLVEARRRSRVVFASGVGLWIGVTTLAGALGGLAIPSVGGVLALALAAALLRLRVEGNAELAPAQPPSVGRVIAPAGETDEERGLHRRLRALMQEERAYREGGLTVGILAARLGVPEYRLRRLINQRLGHRNFTSFANGYRLAEAMAALADPAQARVPVLTIALDAGFQSIGPFNRAFKAHTGQTPSEFRRAQLARQPAAG